MVLSHPPRHFRRISVIILTSVLFTLLFILLVFYYAINIIPHNNVYDSTDKICHIPDVDPFDPSILKFVKPVVPIECSDRPPLTYTTERRGRQLLVVDEDAATIYDTFACCYSVISRITDWRNEETLCVNFTQAAVLNISVEFLYVKCIDEKTGEEIYTNMHAVVQKRPLQNIAAVKNTQGLLDVEVRSSSEDDVNSLMGSDTSSTATNDVVKPSRRLNVLFLGIDSMSRLNFMRTMPKTLEHLKVNDWLEFRGYNKVADNTIPNLLAILAGLSLGQIKEIDCYPEENTYIDKCPYIWNEFRDSGYYTAFAEDEFQWSTFNWKQGGFIKQPTDFYFRAFVNSATKKLKLVIKDSFAVCLGPSSTTNIFLKLALDLVKTHEKLFALLWLNNFSHNNMNNAAAYDLDFLQFMDDLKESGGLENTMILLLSDHGLRFGTFRETYIGWLEERLPFFFMWVPKWFREAYPDVYNNLKAHTDMLTTPYDLHLTLKDIVDETVGESSSGCRGCSKCRSLFSAPIVNRSCEDAGISSHWCACAPQVSISTSSDIVMDGAKHSVDVINNLISVINGSCAHLKLNSILDARQKEHLSKEAKDFDEYTIVFNTLPGMALFDTSIRYFNKGRRKNKYKVVGPISRINSYGEKSNCVSKKELRLYCHCIVP